MTSIRDEYGHTKINSNKVLYPRNLITREPRISGDGILELGFITDEMRAVRELEAKLQQEYELNGRLEFY